MSGSPPRYNVYAGDKLVALLSFGANTWKLAARDSFIDWQQRSGFKPVVLETFVETERHRGTSFKAANWIQGGKTVGRGKKSRVHEQIIPVKEFWLYPLRQNLRAVLRA